jgi:hypothetical protein
VFEAAEELHPTAATTSARNRRDLSSINGLGTFACFINTAVFDGVRTDCYKRKVIED